MSFSMSDMIKLEVFGKECRVLVTSVVAQASWWEKRTRSDEGTDARMDGWFYS